MGERNHHHEELVNALTHGVGIAASLAGGGGLIALALLSGDPRRIVGATVFVLALLLLYSASTLYHVARDEVHKARFKVLDHCAIFILIAGTYTPFSLISLRGAWGWGLFATVWALAAIGVIFKLFYTGRFKRVSTAIYLAMGWLVVGFAGPLSEAVSNWALFWLLAGGVCYSAGTWFYLNHKMPYAHGVWHAFVLGGSVCHYFAVLTQILPAAA